MLFSLLQISMKNNCVISILPVMTIPNWFVSDSFNIQTMIFAVRGEIVTYYFAYNNNVFTEICNRFFISLMLWNVIQDRCLYGKAPKKNKFHL